MAEYLERYAVHFGLPVRLNSTVTRLGRSDGRYTLTVGQRPIVADRVVVSIGPSQHPVVPSFAAQLDPATTQLHSAAYRNPSQLPTGDILVVGAGNSGSEIAVELAKVGRHVISVRSRRWPHPFRWAQQ